MFYKTIKIFKQNKNNDEEEMFKVGICKDQDLNLALSINKMLAAAVKTV